jgi:hypothetical protein
MRVTIRVTREDIDIGQAKKCHTCPVALAINRVLSPDYRSSVGWTDLTIFRHNPGGWAAQYETPAKAARFIMAFDDGTMPHEVSPFEFELDIPEVALRVR